MPTIKLTLEKALELMEEPARVIPVGYSPWKYGHSEEYVAILGGKFWLFELDFQPQEGYVDCDIVAEQVEPIADNRGTEWEIVKDDPGVHDNATTASQPA